MSARKPNGRSSIYEDAQGRWHGYVTMGVKPDGKPDRRHRTGKTEAEVTAKVQKLEQERDAGNVKRPGRPPTMREWITTFLDTIAPQSIAPISVDKYWTLSRAWIIPHIGNHRIDQLEPEYLDALYAAMIKAGRSVNYMIQAHQLVYHFFNSAMKRRKVTRNVAQLIDLPKLIEKEIQPYSQKEARAILAAARGRRNSARWSVGLSAGLRQGEVLGLRWSYLDLDTGEVRVWWQLQHQRYAHGCDDPHACGARRHRPKCPKDCTRHRKHPCPKPCPVDCAAHASTCPQRSGGPVFRQPKGKRRRTFALAPELVTILKQHRAAQRRERMAAGTAWKDHDLVFSRPDGTPIHRRDDHNEWTDLLAAAGVRPGRLHDGRHTAATLLIEQGVNVRVVQEILGHTDLRDTQRYTHVASAAHRDAAARIGTALFADG